MLDHLWHLLGSKSHLIIGQQSGKNTRYYCPVLRKKTDSKGMRISGRGGREYMSLFGIKVSIINQKVEMLDIIVGEEGGGGLEVGLEHL